jgi:hypothetical protein
MLILSLPNGRKIKLPDHWLDWEARALRDRILAGEVTEERIEGLEMQAELESGSAIKVLISEIRKLRAVMSADRVMIGDKRSRVDIPKA